MVTDADIWGNPGQWRLHSIARDAYDPFMRGIWPLFKHQSIITATFDQKEIRDVNSKILYVSVLATKSYALVINTRFKTR